MTIDGIIMMVDYHIHFMSQDVVEKHKPMEYVKVAKNKYLDEIGFSDHFAVTKLGKIDYSMNNEELSKYVRTLQGLKKETDFPVKIGIEMDFFPDFEKKIEKILKTYPFDYVSGGVHFIGDWGVDDPSDISEYKKWNINKLYNIYFNLIKQASKSGLFDVIVHADLIKIFGFKPKNDLTSLFEGTSEILKENKICIEINTNGLNRPCKEIYPSEEFLKLCYKHDVPITLGSDAHNPKSVGQSFDKAFLLIKKIGYENIATFENRKMKLVELSEFKRI